MSKQMVDYEVTAPDGKVLILTGPAGASQDEVLARAKAMYKPSASSAPDFSTVQSGSSTTAPPPKPNWRDIAAQAEIQGMSDIASGFGKGVGSVLQTGGQWIEDIPRQVQQGMTGQQLPSQVTPMRMTPTGRDAMAPENSRQAIAKALAQTGMAIGGAAAAGPAVASQMVAGAGMGPLLAPGDPYTAMAVGAAAPPVAKGVQSAASITKALIRGTEPAAAKFQQVMGAAKDVPLNLEAADDVAIRALELAGRGAKTPGAGSSLPKVMSDYIKTRELNLPVTYETGRDFATAASRLSAAEAQAANPVMQRQVALLAKALANSNREAAVKAGVGQLYDDAMREYRLAKGAIGIKDALASVLKDHGAKVAVGAGAGYGAYKALAK